MAYRMKWLPVMVPLCAASLAGVIWSGSSLYQAADYNRRLAQQAAQPARTANPLFAEAWRMKQAGQTLKALDLYASAASKGDDKLRKRALYNSGNLYLQQAIAMLEAEGYAAWDNVNPLLLMAREHYVKALQIDPGWAEAKYNLELVLRFYPSFDGVATPDRDDEKEDAPADLPSGWPSIPGFPRGMP